MKYNLFRLRRWYVFMLAAVAFCDVTSAQSKQYTLADDSKIQLSGATNVNKFRCDCEARFDVLQVQQTPIGAQVSYRNAALNIPAKTFNCHNEKMNRDMYDAMKAEQFPFIKIELLESQKSLTTSTPNAWQTAQAKIKLTITNVTRQMQATVRIRHLSNGLFELEGKKSILLTDFGITPPVAVMGLIKVNNEISLNFNLKISTN